MSSDERRKEKGKNLELFAEMYELEKEAERLPKKTNAEVARSLEGSGHDAEKARELGRRAAEAFAKAEAEQKTKKENAKDGGGTGKDGPEKGSGGVVRLDERRKMSRAIFLLPIAAAIALVMVEGDAIVAWVEDAPDAEVRLGHAHPDLTPEQAARRLRESARGSCAAGRYEECSRSLDDARKLDPKGDADEKVQELRRRAAAGLAGEAGESGGPPP